MLRLSFTFFLGTIISLCHATERERNIQDLIPNLQGEITRRLPNKDMGNYMQASKTLYLHGEKNYGKWIGEAQGMLKKADPDLDDYILRRFGCVSNCIYRTLKQKDVLSFQELLDYLLSKNTITKKNKLEIYVKLLSHNALAGFDYFESKFPIKTHLKAKIFKDLADQNAVKGFEYFSSKFSLPWMQEKGFIEKGEVCPHHLNFSGNMYVEIMIKELANNPLSQKFILLLIEGMYAGKSPEENVDYGSHRIDVMYIAACTGNVDLLKKASKSTLKGGYTKSLDYQLFYTNRKIIDTLLMGALYYKQEESISYLIELGAGIPEYYLQSEEEFKKYLDKIESYSELKKKVSNIEGKQNQQKEASKYDQMIKKGEITIVPWEAGIRGQGSLEGMRKLLLEGQQKNKNIILKDISNYVPGTNRIIDLEEAVVLAEKANYLRAEDLDFVLIEAVNVYMQLVNNKWDSQRAHNFSDLVKFLLYVKNKISKEMEENTNVTPLQDIAADISDKIKKFIKNKQKEKSEKAQRALSEIQTLITSYKEKAQQGESNR